jgi:hypothetical protein
MGTICKVLSDVQLAICFKRGSLLGLFSGAEDGGVMVRFQWTIWGYISEDGVFHNHHRENFIQR